ncbi:MAG TPA: acyltransferase [Flavobacteriaceae bacterium]|nr:acyltransferase [Flavobacteriaceae bacterium]
MKIDHQNRIFGLDIMRAVAIMLVVISHTIWIFPDTKNLFTDLLSMAGVLGVEIFFVLSGFLIGRIIYRLFVDPDFNFKKVKYFWVRRWFRTLPNYYIILILNMVMAIWFNTPLPDNLWRYFFFLQNFAWEMPFFFGESWSLPIEEFAYILAPLLLYLVMFIKVPVSKSKLFGSVTVLVILLFIATKIIYNSVYVNKDMMFWNINLKAITIYRIDAIYYGILAAYISIVKPSYWHKNRVLVFALGVFVFLGLNVAIPVCQIFIDSHPFFWNVLYLPINSFVFVCCLPLLSGFKKQPKFIGRPITLISTISYAMYLLHYSVVLKLMMNTYNAHEIESIIVKLLYLFVYFFFTTILSYFFYRIYEKPMTDLRDIPLIKNHFK